MIALAAALWLGTNLSRLDPPGAPLHGSFIERVVESKHLALWVTVGYEHDGDFTWPARQRLWFQTPSGWVRDSLAYVVDEGARHGVRLGEHAVRLPRDAVWRQRGRKNGRVGAVLFVVLPGACCDVKIEKVEARP